MAVRRSVSRFLLASAVVFAPGFLHAALPDPIFSNGFEDLAGFRPALTFAREGSVNAPTIPEALTVRLSTAPPTDTFVAITSDDPLSLQVQGGGVTVPAGMTAAQVSASGLMASATPIPLTATLNGVSRAAHVRVVGASEEPVLVALDPVQATIPPGGSVAFTVELDIPAPAGGRTIDLTLDPASAGVVPATVVVAADQLSAGFSYTDAGLVSSATVTATLGAGAPLSAEITIQPARPPGRPVSAGP